MALHLEQYYFKHTMATIVQLPIVADVPLVATIATFTVAAAIISAID